MELPRYARKDFEVTPSATRPDGSAAELTGVRFALCDHGGPTGDTAWQDGGFAGGVGTGTVVGRDAPDKADALELTVARAELWGLPVQEGGVLDPWHIDTIEST